MRKLSLLTLVAGTIAIAACGSDDGGSGSPLDNALRYLPANAPFAAAIDTERFKSGDISDELPFGDQVQQQLDRLLGERREQLEQIRSALGNEFVVGSTDSRSFVDSPSGEDEAFVGAIQVRDEGALDKLIEGDRAEQDGEAEGAKLYKDDSGDSFAVDGDVLVVAGSKQELKAALATRNGDESLTEDEFEAGTEDVDDDALARVYLNVAELLQSSPDARDALKSKWVAALRTAGIGLEVEGNRIEVDVDVDTDPSGLTDADLPIAAGERAPWPLDGVGDVNLALRDPAQVLEFAQATAQAVSTDFRSFEAGKAQIEQRLGVDLDEDLVAQLDGDLQVSIGLDDKFGARAELKDPAAFERTLTKLEDVLPNVAEGIAGGKVGFAKPKAGEDFYAVATSGGDQVVFGVVGDYLVVSNSPAIAGKLATAEARAVPDAEGALAMSSDAEQIAQKTLEQAMDGPLGLGDRLRGQIGTQPLDQLLGSIEASTEGLSGSFTLTTN